MLPTMHKTPNNVYEHFVNIENAWQNTVRNTQNEWKMFFKNGKEAMLN